MCTRDSGSARRGNHKKRSAYLKIELISRLGDGAFADVWKAKDELDRDVAVKIVRASGVVMASALSHAKGEPLGSSIHLVLLLQLCARPQVPANDPGNGSGDYRSHLDRA